MRTMKPKKSARKAGRVVAKVEASRAYATPDLGTINTDWAAISEGIYAPKCDPVPVFVLPADAASVERMVEQAAKAACAADGLDWSKQADPMTSGSGADDQSAYIATARAALAAIGIRAR